jgi:UPF0716 protein FxsA
VPLILLLIFLGIPIIEIALFIQAGSLIGLWPTLAAIVATAIIGGAIIRAQGLAVLARARQSLDRNEPPVNEVFTGLCLLVAGALLMTPGFLTDSLGFLLLVPTVRRSLGKWLLSALLRSRNAHVWVDGEEIVTPEQRRRDEERRGAIDVDFTEVPADEDEPHHKN